MACVGFLLLFGLSCVVYSCEGGTSYTHFYDLIVSCYVVNCLILFVCVDSL